MRILPCLSDEKSTLTNYGVFGVRCHGNGEYLKTLNSASVAHTGFGFSTPQIYIISKKIAGIRNYTVKAEIGVWFPD